MSSPADFDITASPTLRMASVANFQVTRSSAIDLRYTRISFGRLYLRQIMYGSGTNQSDVIEPNASTGLGKTAVNKWGIYDSIASNARLIAYGQGMHTQAGDWHNWFTMVFTDERYKRSTLEIMGSSFDEPNEWAIVGGTGEFVMAQGIIKRTEIVDVGTQKIQELVIDAYCRLMAQVPRPTMTAAGGGNGGVLNQMEGKSQRLESVAIRHENVVESFSFTYINEDGEIRTAGLWGGHYAGNKIETTIKFGPSEYVKAIKGITGSNGFLSRFNIITNLRTYGDYGSSAGSGSFNITVPEDKTVVGFFAYSGDNVYKIGAYTI